MSFTTVLTCIVFLCTTGWAQYVLEDDYTANGNFFQQFSFFEGEDPTHGFVDYVDQSSAQQAGLINTNGGKVHMGVSNETIVSSSGRPSVRVTSNKSYNSGLVILDLEHMPSNTCGTWPAFWMVGPSWPTNGEIDIIEGVNEQTCNDMTLHTGPDCSITNTADMLGSISHTDCDVSSGGDNTGCQITTTDAKTYGSGFNENDGGVYATQWTSSSIQIFFFPRGSIPSDISNGSPDPSSWGKPMANFQGGCDISNSFKDLQIVFDITFCGDWAGGSAWTGGSCASKGSCQNYVQNNGGDFVDSYWTVNSLKVYQNNGGYSSSSGVSAYGTPSAHSVSSVVSASATMPYAANSSSVIPAFPTQASTTASVNSVPAVSAPAPGVSSATGWEPHWHHWTKTAYPVPRAEPTDAPSSLPEHLPSDDGTTAQEEQHHAAHETQSIEAHAGGHSRELLGDKPRISAQRMARHLRQHKRHVTGRL